jgi:hypothetical protein
MSCLMLKNDDDQIGDSILLEASQNCGDGLGEQFGCTSSENRSGVGGFGGPVGSYCGRLGGKNWGRCTCTSVNKKNDLGC